MPVQGRVDETVRVGMGQDRKPWINPEMYGHNSLHPFPTTIAQLMLHQHRIPQTIIIIRMMAGDT